MFDSNLVQNVFFYRTGGSITPLHGTFLWKMSDLVSDRELLPLEEMAVTALKSQNSISNYTNLYSKWFHVRFVDF
jgi:hypothetical protein